MRISIELDSSNESDSRVIEVLSRTILEMRGAVDTPQREVTEDTPPKTSEVKHIHVEPEIIETPVKETGLKLKPVKKPRGAPRPPRALPTEAPGECAMCMTVAVDANGWYCHRHLQELDTAAKACKDLQVVGDAAEPIVDPKDVPSISTGIPPVPEEQLTLPGTESAERPEAFADFGGDSATAVPEPEIPEAQLRALLQDALMQRINALGAQEGRAIVRKWAEDRGFRNTGPMVNADGSPNPNGIPADRLMTIYKEARAELDQTVK